MYKIISSKSENWKFEIDRCINIDYYHTLEYHNMDTSGESVLFCFTYFDTTILLPLILRPIEGTSFFDTTSVYGYCGPIFNVDSIDEAVAQRFREEFLMFCKERSIVSVFSRLHPLIDNQEMILQGLGEVLPLNKTVSIDLSLSLEEQRKHYRKSIKYDINQLIKKGVIVREATSPDDIDRFIEIYWESMRRVEASPFYFFSKEYFIEFIAKIKSFVLVAEMDGVIIAGALFTICGDYMQYHLAGTADDYLSLAPMKIILDEARIMGTNLGLKKLHLGGGVGGGDDALFRFKSGFSKTIHQFKVWRYIVDVTTYDQLVNKRFGDIIPESNFFPLYRM